MDIEKKKIILQIVPSMEIGGAEAGTVEISRFMKQKGWKVIVASSGGSLIRNLALDNIIHVKLPMNSKNPLIIIINIFRLAWVIKKYRIKIVHVRSRAPAWSAYYACSMFRGIKFITTVHGAYNNQNLLKKFYNSIMLKSHKIIAISKYIKQYLIKNFKFSKKKLEKIIVIPRGIDPEKFKPERIQEKRIISLSSAWEIPDGLPVILFPSRIASFKGHKTLLKAISILAKDPENKFICLILGTAKKNSNYNEELSLIINQNKLFDYVKFIGHCKDMPAAYKLSDIVISPADKPEGFGRIIIEAQAMNRPVIASGHGGSLELIKNNYNGFLFKPKDEYDLANKIKHVLLLPKDKKDKIIKNANIIVKENYNLSKMCNSNFNLYNSLIN